jgi:hypothetical protein
MRASTKLLGYPRDNGLATLVLEFFGRIRLPKGHARSRRSGGHDMADSKIETATK